MLYLFSSTWRQLGRRVSWHFLPWSHDNHLGDSSFSEISAQKVKSVTFSHQFNSRENSFRPEAHMRLKIVDLEVYTG